MNPKLYKFLHPKGKHAIFWRTAIVVTCIFIASAIFGMDNNLIDMIRAKIKTASYRRQIEQLDKMTEEMDAKIRRLKSDPDSLEKFAREKFHFSAAGEDVYIIGGN